MFAKSYFILAIFDTFVKREVNDDITSWIIEDYQEFMELSAIRGQLVEMERYKAGILQRNVFITYDS